MALLVYESIGELLGLIGSAIGSVLLTIGGALVEQAAVQNVLAGQLVLGAWEAWVGTLALTVGLYLLGYQECWPRLQRLRHSG